MNRGDAVQLVYNCVVTEINGDSIRVHDNEKNMDFYINGAKLISTLGRANEFTSTQKVSKTEIVEKLLTSHGKILSVEFEKQSGERRVLRGYLAKAEPLLGRSYCVDIDVVEDNKLRLVDHRTIHWLICDNVKYYV